MHASLHWYLCWHSLSIAEPPGAGTAGVSHCAICCVATSPVVLMLLASLLVRPEVMSQVCPCGQQTGSITATKQHGAPVKGSILTVPHLAPVCFCLVYFCRLQRSGGWRSSGAASWGTERRHLAWKGAPRCIVATESRCAFSLLV